VKCWNLSDYASLPRGWTRGLCLLEDGFCVGSTAIRKDTTQWISEHGNTWNFDAAESRTAVSFVCFASSGLHEDATASVHFLNARRSKVFSILTTPLSAIAHTPRSNVAMNAPWGVGDVVCEDFQSDQRAGGGSSSSSSPPATVATAAQPNPVHATAPVAASFAVSTPRNQQVVLCTHGSMCPVHLGHVKMMETAKTALEARGFTVIAGVIAITDVGRICAKGVDPMADSLRLQLLDAIIKDSGNASWLRHCDGDGVNVKTANQLIECNLPCSRHWQGANVICVSVEGSDVFRMYQHGPPGEKGLLIVVARTGEEAHARAKREGLPEREKERTLILPADASGLLGATSSTCVREAVAWGDYDTVVAMCGEAVAALLFALCRSKAGDGAS